MMEPAIFQALVWVLGIAVAIIGFFLKGTLDKLDALELRYNTLHEAYVKKDDFSQFRNDLFSRLDRIDAAQTQIGALREHEMWEKLNALESRIK